VLINFSFLLYHHHPPCPRVEFTTYVVPSTPDPSNLHFEQHRNLQPTGPPSQGGPPPQAQSRLSEAFDMIRQEHDLLISEMNIVRSQRDELENKGMPLPTSKKIN